MAISQITDSKHYYVLGLPSLLIFFMKKEWIDDKEGNIRSYIWRQMSTCFPCYQEVIQFDGVNASLPRSFLVLITGHHTGDQGRFRGGGMGWVGRTYSLGLGGGGYLAGICIRFIII